MTSRERFLSACKQEYLERPPIWIMRQAGRYLPEYRALKEKHSFLNLLKHLSWLQKLPFNPSNDLL